jgi:hypothetical protein
MVFLRGVYDVAPFQLGVERYQKQGRTSYGRDRAHEHGEGNRD